MHKVIIDGEIHYAQDGEVLYNVLTKSYKFVEHPCGGKGICKKCSVTVNGKQELSCRYIIKSDIVVTFSKNAEVISATGASETGIMTDNVCLALDIGTTTLALALVSLDNKKIIKVITRTNPQIIFGADVMSRIDYCSKNGVKELNAVLISEINSMISEFVIESIENMYISGNATMLHIFYGVDCSSLGVAPYTPIFLERKLEKAEKLGIFGVENVESLPSIATFVGADLVAGLNYVDKPEKGKHNLLVDLGTNAEVVLFSEKVAFCTSAAAGPCFEGANISCGMSATNGAIYSYSKNDIKIVGNIPAVGICGTGLVDVVSKFIEDGIIDETGLMENEETEIVNGVYINQADIRQYQLAKSAVYSAIMTLLKMKEISFDDIDKIYISGGFSSEINIDNAVKTGLLPNEFKDKCVAVNNSSLLGTVKYACERNDLSKLVDNATYVDLSSSPEFSELFIANMMFGAE